MLLMMTFLTASLSLLRRHAPDDVVQRDGPVGGADAGPTQRARVATFGSHLLQTAGTEGVATAEGGGPVEHLQTDGTLQLLRQTRDRRALLDAFAPLVAGRLSPRLSRDSSVLDGAGGRSCSSVDLQRHNSYYF